MSITLDITNSQITMTTDNENGGKQIKIIDPDDLVSALSSQAKIETGLLPSNTRYFSSNGQISSIILEVKQHVRKINMCRELLNVPFPGCIMLVTLINQPNGTKHISQTYFYCYKDIVLNSKSRLYKFPYGNVFLNGTICWGSVPFPKITELFHVGVLPDTFLNSNFNGHIDSGTFNRLSKVENGRNVDIVRGSDLARHFHTEGVTVFPSDILAATDLDLTYFIKNIGRERER